MNKYFPMTKEGEEKLKNELNILKNYKLIEIINEISEARKYGDLKENSEYQYAKEKQLLYGKRIIEIENKLYNSIVVDIKKIEIKNRVVFGSTIIIKNINSNIINNYTIVGEDEFDINKNKISINSPIAIGFIGKKIGSIITINTNNNIIKYELLDIKKYINEK